MKTMFTKPIRISILISISVVFLFAFKQYKTSTTSKNKLNEVKQLQDDSKIKWYTIQEAAKLCKKKPKKIFIDVFTDWCGWCKKLDAVTFTNPVIVKYMNEHYYAVKFNAETGDTIKFRDTTYTNRYFGSRNPHDLAVKLLNNRMGYPSMVLLDEKLNNLYLVQSFLWPNQLEAYLKFYGDDVYKTKTMEEYFQTFQGEIKQ